MSRPCYRLAVWVALACLVAGSDAVQQLGGLHGTFSTPNYPQVYADNLDETWQITVKPNFRIKIRFTSFDLEDSYEEGRGPCVYDFVLIMEGTKEIGRFCGNKLHYPMDAPRPDEWFYTVGNSATVRFVSDYSNEGITPTGFQAHYVEEDIDECAEMKRKEMYTVEDWDELLTCDHYCNNVQGSFYCSCRSQYTLHADQHTCIATFCENQELTADEGFVESPAYPGQYAKYADCSWHIRVRDGLSVHLTFQDPFAVEKHVDEGCAYDKLKIAYGGREKEYCGDEVPSDGQVMDMNTRDVAITFTSDRSVEMAGFKIKYNTSRIRCLHPLNAPTHGRISPNPKGYYEFEDVVTFNCIRGYEFSPGSEERLECLSNGQWNHPQPKCQIKVCGEPEDLTAVKYSSIVDRNTKRFEYGERVTVKCDSWYKMAAGYATWRCEDSKQWVGDSGMLSEGVPKCRPKCGIKGAEDNSLLSVHIAGGTESEKGEWPWMAFLNFGRTKRLGATGFSCGGTIISPNYILTAAHCLNTTDYPGEVRWANHTHVWLGVHSRDAKLNTVKYVSVESILLHPLYFTPGAWNYDVALIRLRETIIMGNNIRPICLPSAKDAFNLVKPEATGEVAGWGRHDAGFRPSEVLKHAQFPIVGLKQCWKSFQERSLETGRDLRKDLTLTENMFCAGFRLGSQSTCQGDSGGPFMMTKKDSSLYYQVGLVSFGIGEKCGIIISYTVFTKFNHAIVDWVLENTNNLE